MDVESLRAFREVVAQGGFTAASKVLGITQPAVSLKISRLEERIGSNLLRREGNSFTVTAHGRDLLAHAEKIVEAHDRAVEHMRRSELSGSLRLGCNAEIALSGLHRLTSRFRRTHPAVDLAIRVNESRILSELLDDGEIDVAILRRSVLEGAVRPTDEILQRDRLHAVQGLTVDFEDSDPVPLVAFGPSNAIDPYLRTALAAAGRTYRTALEWPSVSGVRSAIEDGMGVGILSTPLLTEQMRPWNGISPTALPALVFVLRSRADAERNELIDTLREHLSEDFAATLT